MNAYLLFKRADFRQIWKAHEINYSCFFFFRETNSNTTTTIATREQLQFSIRSNCKWVTLWYAPRRRRVICKRIEEPWINLISSRVFFCFFSCRYSRSCSLYSLFFFCELPPRKMSHAYIYSFGWHKRLKHFARICNHLMAHIQNSPETMCILCVCVTQI